MKNKLLISILSALTISCGNADIQTSCITSGVLFGDSISAGYNTVNKLSNKTGLSIIDLATPAETTVNAITGYKNVYTQEPLEKYSNYYTFITVTPIDFVIIRYGAAEAYIYGNHLSFYYNLKNMVKFAKEQGKTVILIGVTEFVKVGEPYNIDDSYVTKATEFDSEIKRVAEETNSVFVNVRTIENVYVFDGIHPTDEYADQQIELISNQLKSMKCHV